MKLSDLARLLACRLHGDPDLEITGLAPIESAVAGQLTFLSNPKYRRHLAATRASAVIIEDHKQAPDGMAALVSETPYLTFAYALELFRPAERRASGIHPQAVVAPDAVIGRNCRIGPFSFIGAGVRIGDNVSISSHCAIYDEAVIGDDVLIHSHAVIRERCVIGAHVIVQNHVTIGGDGFGYAKKPDGTWHKIPQTGIVIVEDDVEIGAGATIDRAAIGVTKINRGAKIDNLVQVGHGSVVGVNTLLCAQVGLAGSTQVGDNVILGGQVGAAGHLQIGDGVIATAQSGIPNSVAAGSVVSGYPSIDARAWRKAVAAFPQLPALLKEVRSLKHQLKQLEERLEKQHADSH